MISRAQLINAGSVMNSKCLAMMLLCINDALALAPIILQYYSLSGILGQQDCLAECSLKSKTICKYANKM